MNERDNRREHRREGSGAVRVNFTDPEPLQIDGKLMDVSTNGFRMAHDCASLHSGQLVEFSHVEARGRARVIWNRIQSSRVETGFLIVVG